MLSWRRKIEKGESETLLSYIFKVISIKIEIKKKISS